MAGGSSSGSGGAGTGGAAIDAGGASTDAGTGLTTSWAQYTVPFADAVGGANRVSGVVQQLGWLTPDANWDFWLDEIQFYKDTPPAIPVGGNSTM